MKGKAGSILFFIALIALSSCLSRNRETVTNPTITKDITPKIVMIPWPGMPQTQKVGDILDFQIKNLSSETIVFDQNFETKIYQKVGTNWVSIENGQRFPEGENILLPNEMSPGGLSLFVFPQLDNIKTSTVVRIKISGHVQNKPANIVTTYVDVLYNP